MKTILFTQISIPFIIVVIVVCLIALAIGLAMKDKNKAVEKTEPDLTEKQRQELERLNKRVDTLEYLIKERQNTILNRDNHIASLESQLSASERMIKLRDTEITRLKNELESPKANDVTLKIGDTITGRIIPNSQKIVTGKIKGLTRRGNYLLNSGQTVSKDEAVFVG